MLFSTNFEFFLFFFLVPFGVRLDCLRFFLFSEVGYKSICICKLINKLDSGLHLVSQFGDNILHRSCWICLILNQETYYLEVMEILSKVI